MIPGNFGYTFVPLLLLVVPACGCNVLWVIFCVVAVNKLQTAAVLFVIPTILGQELFIALSMALQMVAKK